MSFIAVKAINGDELLVPVSSILKIEQDNNFQCTFHLIGSAEKIHVNTKWDELKTALTGIEKPEGF